MLGVMMLGAGPATLSGATITLNGIPVSNSAVTVIENGTNGFSIGSCIGDCLLQGQASELGFTLPWSITGLQGSWSFSSPPTTPNTGTFIVSGGFASFSINDFSDPGGGDKIGGSVDLNTFVDNGDGTAALFGTLTVNSQTFLGLDSSTFEAILGLANITVTDGVATGTVPLEVQVIGCTNGGSVSVCFLDPVPVTVVGAVSSVTLNQSSASVPEPGTLALLFSGIGIAAFARIWSRMRFFSDYR